MFEKPHHGAIAQSSGPAKLVISVLGFGSNNGTELFSEFETLKSRFETTNLAVPEDWATPPRRGPSNISWPQASSEFPRT